MSQIAPRNFCKHIGLYFTSFCLKGGTEKEYIELANNLSARGLAVTLISLFKTVEFPFELNHAVRREYLFEKEYSAKSHYQVLKDVIAQLQQFDLDLLICTETNVILFSILSACKILDVKTIYWDHLLNGLLLSRLPYVEMSSNVVADLADKIVALTRKGVFFWQRKYPKANVAYIPNIVEVQNIAPYSTKRKMVTAIGRLAPQKGFDLLLGVWKDLLEKNQIRDWHLIIVGDTQPGYEEFALSLKLRAAFLENVSFLPATNRIDDIYARTGIFVLPSRFETFGLVLAEAQIQGIPSVAFDCLTGPAEIIKQDKSGFLIPPFDKEAFSEALLELMQNSNLREDFSRQAKKQGDLFLPKNVIPKWIRLLNSLEQARKG